jgi:hypothetical protein
MAVSPKRAKAKNRIQSISRGFLSDRIRTIVVRKNGMKNTSLAD